MDLIFYPTNALFVAAPLLFWCIFILAAFWLVRFTARNLLTVYKAETSIEALEQHGWRLTGNLILIFLLFSVAGSVASVAPRAKIDVRPSANLEYLNRVDTASWPEAGIRAKRSNSPTWEELAERTATAELEQDSRISRAMP